MYSPPPMSEFSPPPMEDISTINDFPPTMNDFPPSMDEFPPSMNDFPSSMNGFSSPPSEMEYDMESSYDLTGLSDKLGSLELDKVKILPLREILELQQESQQLNTVFTKGVKLDIPDKNGVRLDIPDTNDGRLDILDINGGGLDVPDLNGGRLDIPDTNGGRLDMPLSSSGVVDSDEEEYTSDNRLNDRIIQNLEDSETDSEIGIDDSLAEEIMLAYTYHESDKSDKSNERIYPSTDIAFDSDPIISLPHNSNYLSEVDNNDDAFMIETIDDKLELDKECDSEGDKGSEETEWRNSSYDNSKPSSGEAKRLQEVLKCGDSTSNNSQPFTREAEKVQEAKEWKHSTSDNNKPYKGETEGVEEEEWSKSTSDNYKPSMVEAGPKEEEIERGNSTPDSDQPFTQETEQVQEEIEGGNSTSLKTQSSTGETEQVQVELEWGKSTSDKQQLSREEPELEGEEIESGNSNDSQSSTGELELGWDNVWSSHTANNDDDWVSNTGHAPWGDFSEVTSVPHTEDTTNERTTISVIEPFDDEDDEFGDFGLAEDNLLQSLMNCLSLLEGEEKAVLRFVWIQDDHKEDHEEEVVIDRLSDKVFVDEKVFQLVEDPASSPGLEHRWRDSVGYNMLLRTLSIDTRVVLDGESWRSSVPNYTPKTAATLLTPGELLTPMVANTSPSEETGQGMRTPEPEFDWNNSVLTNPLEADSGKSEESLQKKIGNGETPKVITELLSSQKKTQSLKQRGQNCGQEPSTIHTTKEVKKSSKAAAEIVSAFPLLDFMHSKLLMLPSNHKK